MPRPVRPLSPLEVPSTPGSLSSASVDSPFSTYSWDNPPFVSPSAAPGVGVLDMFKLPPTPKPKRRRFTLRLRSKKKVVPCGAYDSNDSNVSYADSGDSRIRWRSITPPPSPRSRDKADREAWKAQHCREKWTCRLLSGGCLCAIIALFHL